MQRMINVIKTYDAKLDKVCELFYNHLLEVAPDTFMLYPFMKDTEEQYRANVRKHTAGLFKMLAKTLTEWDHVKSPRALHSLGERHIKYNVILPQFELMGLAITMALADLLGMVFNSDMEKTWKKVYIYVVHLMTDSNDFKKEI
eukprot:CAMPEP_0170492216 /NCGR_PEP_ID=MMETSP0208-20121228/11864_1 /TAXON_ID=197538 /ORGANISM="Strombidium inclinatum, Strain S3" /LENGTH=143 /DNA_ID=CAMNT_0010767923 /DNA_START=62 /DNA_END=493 /DNA_ORIENTATION=+